MQNQEELEINGVLYVRKDSVYANAPSIDGMEAMVIRSKSAGVLYGYVKEMEHTIAGTLVTLVHARRVHRWAGAASLSQFALEGVKSPSECRFSVVLPVEKIQECIEFLPLSEVALKNLNDVPVWKV